MGVGVLSSAFRRSQGIVADRKHHHLAQIPHHEHQSSATPSDGSVHWLETFRLLAVELTIDIVAGTIVESHPAPNSPEHKQLHNVSHYINSRGEIVGRYTKKNLWWPEKDYLTQGEQAYDVFETDYGKTALLVCWDIAWPEAFRALVLQGVELVIIPTCWLGSDGDDQYPGCEETYLDCIQVARAFENECAIVFVNCGAPTGSKEGESDFIGRSGVSLPFKGLVAKAKAAEEELFFADINLDILTVSLADVSLQRTSPMQGFD